MITIVHFYDLIIPYWVCNLMVKAGCSNVTINIIILLSDASVNG